MACQLAGAPSTGLDIHIPHNLKEVKKEKADINFPVPWWRESGGRVSNDNRIQAENKYTISQMQVASEKFPQEDPQICLSLGVSVII